MQPLVALHTATVTATFLMAVFHVARIRSLRQGHPVRFRPWPRRHPHWRVFLFEWLRNPHVRLVLESLDHVEIPPANRHLRRHFQRRGVPVPDDILEDLNYWDDDAAMWDLLDWLSGLEERVVVDQDQLRALLGEDEEVRTSRVRWRGAATTPRPSDQLAELMTAPLGALAPPALAVPIREAVAA